MLKFSILPGLLKCSRPLPAYALASNLMPERFLTYLQLQKLRAYVLIIPGGIVSDELERETVIKWIARCAGSASITASVCTGAFLLGRAGLLNGKQATTHWEDIPDLRAMFPGIEVKAGTRWVDTGQIVSSAGISAGIDMSLHLVERLESKELAVSTARQMEFDWQNSGLSLC